MKVRIPIIPISPTYYWTAETRTLDLKAIAVFAAIGFFLDDETFFLEKRTFRPGSEYTLTDKGWKQQTYFSWTYEPEIVQFDEVVDRFGELLKNLVMRGVHAKNVILPISGGLDSRTLLVALKGNPNVHSYSYEFKGGVHENYYGSRAANIAGIPHKNFVIPPGYLWRIIDEAVITNYAEAEAVHARQLAWLPEISELGDIFLLGHWGDVLFDSMGVPDNLSFEGQVDVLLRKLIKRGGTAIATDLWRNWKLEGQFHDYLRAKVEQLLSRIDINNANARLRAFKSIHWAHRWTGANIQFFSKYKPVSVPYFDDEMCRFICKVPEKWLAQRKIQIEYIKRQWPELARIPWQAVRPFNLYNYHLNKAPWNIPVRIARKISWSIRRRVQRNWEIQFLGRDNDLRLREWLLDNEKLDGVVERSIRDRYYKAFKENALANAFPVSILLSLSAFAKHYLK
jgi:asparagine synthetase B (glutamine-hydrolysing)